MNDGIINEITNDSHNEHNALLLSPPPSSPQQSSSSTIPVKPSCSRQLNMLSQPKPQKKQARKKRTAPVKDWNLSTLLTGTNNNNSSSTNGSSFDFKRLTERQQLAMAKKRALLEQHGALTDVDETSILRTISPFVLDKIDEPLSSIALLSSKRNSKTSKRDSVKTTVSDSDKKRVKLVLNLAPIKEQIISNLSDSKDIDVVSESSESEPEIPIAPSPPPTLNHCSVEESGALEMKSDYLWFKSFPQIASKYSMLMQEWSIFIQYLYDNLQFKFSFVIINSMLPNINSIQQKTAELETEFLQFTNNNLINSPVNCNTLESFLTNSRVYHLLEELLNVVSDELQILELTWKTVQ